MNLNKFTAKLFENYTKKLFRDLHQIPEEMLKWNYYGCEDMLLYLMVTIFTGNGIGVDISWLQYGSIWGGIIY